MANTQYSSSEQAIAQANLLARPEIIWTRSIYTVTGKTLVMTAVDKSHYMRSSIQNSLGNLLLHNLYYLKMPFRLDVVTFELARLADMELPQLTSALSDSEWKTVAISSLGQRYWAVCESVSLSMRNLQASHQEGSI